jgi:mycothiol synthase
MAVLRQLRDSDVDAVLSVYREAWGDARPIHAGDLRSWLRNPQIDPDTLRVLENNGTVVGYGDVTIADGVVAVEVAAPGHWDTFLAWAEETAREVGAGRVRVLNYAGEALPRAAVERGYYLWRSNYTMRIELESVPPDLPPTPTGIVLRAYSPDEADQLLDAINEVFRPDPFFVHMTKNDFSENYLGNAGMDPQLWVLAWDDAKLAGFSLGFSQWHGDPAVGEIRSVGVRTSWRQRGLGEALVRSTFRALHAAGLRAATLGVDASNETGAVRLYERVGMIVTARGDNWALDFARSRARATTERPSA